MQGRIRVVLFAIAMVSAGVGCRTSTPQDRAAPQALEQRARTLREQAMHDATPTPARKAEFQRLSDEVRAWQARTGRDDLRVTRETVRAARRANGGGGGSECGTCPGYMLDGDRICLLESEGECPVDEGDEDLSIGQICVYSCIWIGSGAEPARAGEPAR